MNKEKQTTKSDWLKFGLYTSYIFLFGTVLSFYLVTTVLRNKDSYSDELFVVEKVWKNRGEVDYFAWGKIGDQTETINVEVFVKNYKSGMLSEGSALSVSFSDKMPDRFIGQYQLRVLPGGKKALDKIITKVLVQAALCLIPFLVFFPLERRERKKLTREFTCTRKGGES